MLDYASDGPRFLLVDLHTGKSALAGRSPNSSAVLYGDASSILAFTPDSRTLLIAGAGGVSAVNVATAKASSLPVPPLAAIAIRPIEAEHPSREIVIAWRAGSSRAAEGRLLAETLTAAAPSTGPEPAPI